MKISHSDVKLMRGVQNENTQKPMSVSLQESTQTKWEIWRAITAAKSLSIGLKYVKLFVFVVLVIGKSKTRNRKHRRAAAKPAACAKPLMPSIPESKGKRKGRRKGRTGRKDGGESRPVTRGVLGGS